jgi:hypothetical protein
MIPTAYPPRSSQSWWGLRNVSHRPVCLRNLEILTLQEQPAMLFCLPITRAQGWRELRATNSPASDFMCTSANFDISRLPIEQAPPHCCCC